MKLSTWLAQRQEVTTDLLIYLGTLLRETADLNDWAEMNEKVVDLCEKLESELEHVAHLTRNDEFAEGIRQNCQFLRRANARIAELQNAKLINQLI